MMKRTLVGIGAAILVLAMPVAAWAHVKVDPGEAVKGSYAVLTFRVPTESDTASTTKLDLQIPTDHPIASVSVQPKPGWKYEVKTAKLAKPIKNDDGAITEAVSEIIWTGGTIKPGEFDTFAISAGPLPTDTDQIEFKALQGYSDGSTVSWIEDTPKNGPEPEHPAPVLKLTAADSDDGMGAAATTPTTAEPAATVSASLVSKSDVDSAKSTAVIGLVIGLIGCLAAAGVGVAGLRRKRTA